MDVVKILTSLEYWRTKRKQLCCGQNETFPNLFFLSVTTSVFVDTTVARCPRLFFGSGFRISFSVYKAPVEFCRLDTAQNRELRDMPSVSRTDETIIAIVALVTGVGPGEKKTKIVLSAGHLGHVYSIAYSTFLYTRHLFRTLWKLLFIFGYDDSFFFFFLFDVDGRTDARGTSTTINRGGLVKNK